MKANTAILISALVLAVAGASARETPIGRSTAPCSVGGAPVVLIDDAHQNSQRSTFRGLMELLAGAGFCVRQSASAITSAALKEARILVISNPGGWDGPEASLNATEVSAVMAWVQAGGSLLLILDHAPAPKNAAMLTAALGVPAWHDGYAMVKVSDRLLPNIIFWQPAVIPTDAPSVGATGPGGGTGYQGKDAVLTRHPITEGRSSAERVQRIATFGGSAFRAPAGAEPLMILPAQAASFQAPGATPSLTVETPSISVAGWLQGAVMKHGTGRVALFGESGFFSGGPAADNRLFILNVIHWLSNSPSRQPPNALMKLAVVSGARSSSASR
jgi:hypothetical protein